MSYSNPYHHSLIKTNDPAPRCGDCISFRLNPTRCILKPSSKIKEYNKCDFFKRNIWIMRGF